MNERLIQRYEHNYSGGLLFRFALAVVTASHGFMVFIDKGAVDVGTF